MEEIRQLEKTSFCYHHAKDGIRQESSSQGKFWWRARYKQCIKSVFPEIAYSSYKGDSSTNTVVII
jgi:hypothetical protein